MIFSAGSNRQNRRTILLRSITAVGLMAASTPAQLLAQVAQTQHQNYPNQPIRLIVPFAEGGTTDIVARAIIGKLSAVLGQPVLIDNQAGSGGILGAGAAARAAPDGYTLCMATVSTHASNPAINPNTGYDPVKDFTPITNIAATPNVIAINPAFPAKDYADFMATLMQSPGKYSYASSGTGGIGHLQMELFKRLTSTVINHVPYAGAGPALTDVAANKVPMIFDNLPSALPFILKGKLLPIAVASRERLPALPNVPTFVELGLDPVNRMAFYGIVGPKDLPKDIAEKLNAAILQTVQDPGVKKAIEQTGSIILTTTPPEFGMQIQAEFDVYKKVVKERKLKLSASVLVPAAS
jgi:tripartite-type tricarboxylate transporter receptor subunit TctC